MATRRLSKILRQLGTSDDDEKFLEKNDTAARGSDTLSVTDNRTGKTLSIEIKDGVVPAKDFAKLRLPNANIGLRVYDPGYTNTAAATSRITYIDGPNGVLTYRGYPIEELATKSNFLEVAYLLIYGALPTKSQLSFWSSRIMKHTYIHQDVAEMMKSFRYDAHPMGMLITALSALGFNLNLSISPPHPRTLTTNLRHGAPGGEPGAVWPGRLRRQARAQQADQPRHRLGGHHRGFRLPPPPRPPVRVPGFGRAHVRRELPLHDRPLL